MRRRSGLCGAVGGLVAAALSWPSAAPAAITIGFTVRVASPGERGTGMMMSSDGQPVPTISRRYAPMGDVRVYLVRVADANRLGGPTRRDGAHTSWTAPDPLWLFVRPAP